ncbi:hypothetical protein GF324_10955 [bacterium]|nr:hypothetical protein [bacterium]
MTDHVSLERPFAFAVSDLHGRRRRYETLFQAVRRSQPDLVFIAGDLLPHGFSCTSDAAGDGDFLLDYLPARLRALRDEMGASYPPIFVILGNDDPRANEVEVKRYEDEGLWTYLHNRCVTWREWTICGYAGVPPSPFQLKDWERYDVSRYVDPGCVSPEEGVRTVETDMREVRFGTIAGDLNELKPECEPDRTIWLFHSPPYHCALDRAALDGRMIDYVPMDVHVGSIAIQRFIELHRPAITLHGHIHEAPRLTGRWRETFGPTHSFQCAHDGEELGLVTIPLNNPQAARRDLI